MPEYSIPQFLPLDLPPEVKPPRRRVNYVRKFVDGREYFLHRPGRVLDDEGQASDYRPVWVERSQRGRKLPRFYADWFQAEWRARWLPGAEVGVWTD